MQSRLHVEGLVIIVGALDVNEAGGRIASNHLQEIGEMHAAKVADYIPAFHANVPRALVKFGQSLNLSECVNPRFLHCARDGEIPSVEINARVGDVVTVNWKLIEGSELRVRKRRRQVIRAKHLCRYPVAETESSFQKGLL